MSWISWILPPGASTFAGDIDRIYYVILVITGIAFFLTEGLLVWFLIKYRARPGQKVRYTHGNNTFEVVWTSVTALTVVILGIMSAGMWDRMKGRDSVPADAMAVQVRVKQFEWNFVYPGPDGRFDTADDFVRRNQLHLPVDRPVVVQLISEDVIHAFNIPAFRVKQDAVPGMHIQSWFQPNLVGEYELGCAELCGLGHYRMRAIVTVHSQDDYQRWLAEQTTNVASR
jgi:cytochrome c oxidase subunit 2